MINTACDLYPEELIEEIKRAYGEDLVDSFDVGFDDVKNTLAKGEGLSTCGYKESLQRTHR
jgi:hypothetical protein